MSVSRLYCVGAVFGLICASATLSNAGNDVPSGQPITLHEVLVDDVNGESWLRFRFIAPRIARAVGEITFAEAGADMEHLCGAVAVPYLAEYALESDLVVISLADQETEFGETNPEATQFFEAFRIKDDACIWEAN